VQNTIGTAYDNNNAWKVRRVYDLNWYATVSGY